MAHYKIVGGPDKSELFNALSVRRSDRPFLVRFTIIDLGGNKWSVKLHITKVEIEDGSGHSWKIGCQAADFGGDLEGFYRTDTRTGYIIETARGKSLEETVRQQIEVAMRSGWYRIKMIIKGHADPDICTGLKLNPSAPLTSVFVIMPGGMGMIDISTIQSVERAD